MSKNVIRYMVSILVAVVEECGAIPSGVMDCIIDQFERYAKVSSEASALLMLEGTRDTLFPSHR